jgi:SAM-dependent methyltransferase
MPHEGDANRLREEQRQFWQASAPRALTEMNETVPQRPDDPVPVRLLQLAGVVAGQRVLDLACGMGEPGFRIAQLVGERGSVLGLDFSQAMTAGGAALARERGIDNITFRAIPTEFELGVAPNSFDGATCQFGLMYMPDPVTAARAVLAALKPGARFAVCTWGPVEHSPSRQLIYEVCRVRPEVSDAPGVDALPTPEKLERVFTSAGFTAFQSETLQYEVYREDTPTACWDHVALYSGTAFRLLGERSEAEREGIRSRAIQLLRERYPERPIALTSEVLFAAGVKA